MKDIIMENPYQLNSEKFGFNLSEYLANVDVSELLFGLFSSLNVIVGAGGQGKTFLAYHILAKILRETDREVVYIDLDNPVSIVKDRGLAQYIVENGLEKRFVLLGMDTYSKLRDKNIVRDLNGFVEYVLSNVNDNTVIFFDSLQNFVDAVNDDGLTFRFFMRLRKYCATKNLIVFVLHHISKVMGWAKGSTNITNMSDMSFMIQAIKENGQVKGWTFSEKKYRYKAPSQFVLMIKDGFDFEITDTALSSEDISILRDLVLFLRENIYSSQQKIIQAMQVRGYSKNKVLDALKTYTDLIRSYQDKNNKNTFRYYVNESSSYLKLINMHVDGEKHEILNMLSNIDEFKSVCVNTSDGVKEFKSITMLKNAIVRAHDKDLPAYKEAILSLINQNQNQNNSDDDDDSVEF